MQYKLIQDKKKAFKASQVKSEGKVSLWDMFKRINVVKNKMPESLGFYLKMAVRRHGPKQSKTNLSQELWQHFRKECMEEAKCKRCLQNGCTDFTDGG